MARTRAAESTRYSPKKISVEDIANGTARLQEVLTAINDFSQEGFPYRDAARSKAELQLRECVKQVFGERSEEFHDYRRCTLRTSNSEETAQSIAAVKRLLRILEEKKLELEGPKPAPTTSIASGTGKVSPVSTAQMRLVPPAPSTTTATKPAQVIPPPSVSITMTTSLPPAPAGTASPPPIPAPVAPRPTISTQSVPKMTVQPTATDRFPAPQALEPPILAPVAPMTPIATQTLPKVPVQPTATGQFPKPQAPPPPPATPEPVATVPPAPPVVVAPTSIPVPPPILTPQPVPPPTVSITREAVPVPMQQAAPEPTPPSPMTSTQPIATQTAQHIPAVQPLTELETLHLIRKVCLRLHAIARQLRLRTDPRPTFEIVDDHDLEDLLRALLRLEFDEVGTEQWTPPYSGNTPKTTLLLNREQIAIVVKKTRPGLTDKDIAEQVAADSGFFSAHNKCTTLFCFIYDPEGRIGSPKRLETDLTTVSNRYRVEVLVAPK